MSSTIQVDKITDIGGNTMLESNGSGTFTSSLPAPTSGIAASAIDSGTIATARLGSGTASSSTFLRGDQTYAAAGGGDFIRLASIDQDLGTSQKIQFTQVFAADYDQYKVIGTANVGSNQQAAVYFRWLNSSNAEQYAASYGYSGYGRYSNTDDSGGNIGFQKMSETSVILLDDFHGGSYGRNIYFDLTLYPRINPSNFRPGFQGQICYNAYNSGNGGWYSQSIGGFYAEDTDLSGGGLQIECNTSWDYVRMNVYGVKNT